MNELKIIGKIYTDFNEKFGVPRQAGLCSNLEGKIVLSKEYRRIEAVKGLEEFSHIWLLWQFNKACADEFSPTVRPPRLGGNKRVGVFASRSPFRPNSIGMSCVKIERIDLECQEAPVIYVSGIDMINETPLIDIKPYIPMTDCKTDASEGYTAETKKHALNVNFPKELIEKLPENKREAAIGILALDPRPSYIDDPDRIYGVTFAAKNIKFTVSDSTLTVLDVT